MGKHALHPDFLKLIANNSELQIIVAIRACQTRAGVERIYAAESLGRKREAVLNTAVMRLETWSQKFGSSGKE